MYLYFSFHMKNGEITILYSLYKVDKSKEDLILKYYTWEIFSEIQN